MYDRNWFLSRNYKEYRYQKQLIEETIKSMDENEKTVLAACPSAGKTLISIFIISRYLRLNPTHKILILAHGQKILRSQYYDVLLEVAAKGALDFTFDKAENCEEYLNSTAQVIVTLPHSLKNCDIKPANLLIVDEAHQFYFAKDKELLKTGRAGKRSMVTKIIEDSGVTKQILLTGTPSKFILRKYPLVAVCLNDIYDEGQISDTTVELLSSTYGFKFKDFNDTTKALKDDVEIKEGETNSTLDALIKKIYKHLRRTKIQYLTNVTPDWLSILKKLEKTMLVCSNRPQARQVKKYFDELGVKSILTISELNDGVKAIKEFKSNKDISLLIVVGRGILGFNYEDLVNVVDMSMRYNIDYIYQLLCRVVRKSKIHSNKFFFKVVPNDLASFFKYIMEAVIMMNKLEFYTKFNGKNLDNMELPYKKTRKSKGNITITDGGRKKKKQKKYNVPDFGELSIFKNKIFRDVIHWDDKLLNLYAFTTFKNFRAQDMDFKPNGFWTDENLFNSAQQHKLLSNWIKYENAAYQIAKDRGKEFFDKCTAHMDLRNKWETAQDIYDSTIGCASYNEWGQKYPGALDAAYNLGITNEVKKLLPHKKISSGYWDSHIDELLSHGMRCQEKYNNRTEWQTNKEDGKYYQALKRRGLLEQYCTKYTPYQRELTMEVLEQSAKQYENSTLTIWEENDASVVVKLRSLKLLDSFLSKYNIKSNASQKELTKEEVFEISKSCHTIPQLMKFNHNAYSTAVKSPWYKELINEMKKRRENDVEYKLKDKRKTKINPKKDEKGRFLKNN